MDRLDVALLRTLLGGPSFPAHLRKPAKLIAKELGVDEATVRSRLKNWEESGFLVYWGVTINQLLLGKYRYLLRFEMEEELKESALEKVRLVEGVYRIRDYLGKAVAVGLFYDNEKTLENRVDLVLALTGGQNPVRVALEKAPRPRGYPDETDMLILGALGWSARSKHVSIAKETGLSPKTVRKRLENMLEKEVIGGGLFLDYRRISGAPFADLLVVHNEEEKDSVRSGLVQLLGERLMPPTLSVRGATGFRVVMDSVSDRREILRAVRGLKGVKSAYLDLLVEDILVAETYYAVEREMLEKMNARRPLRPSTYKIWGRSWKISTRDIYPRG